MWPNTEKPTMEWACVVSASGAANYNEDHELGSRKNWDRERTGIEKELGSRENFEEGG